MNPSRRRALAGFAAAALSLPAFARPLGSLRPPGLDEEGFLRAVKAGDTATVGRMLARNAGLASARDAAGVSAFVHACLGGHTEIAKRLRKADLELDMVEAVLAEDWDRMEALAKTSPQRLEALHPVGGTALYGAALVGSRGFWRLRALGADPDAAPKGGTGFTPARGAMESPRTAWGLISATDLLANGADVNAKQRGGDSVLHGAVRRRDERLVRLAIRKGADVTAGNGAGHTPEALARAMKWEEGAKLLARHALLPRDNRSSRFALTAAREPVRRPDLSDVPLAKQRMVTGLSHAKLDRVKELVSADPRLVFSLSGDDELPIEAAAHVGQRAIIRYHLDHGAPLSLPTAVSLGDEETVKFLLAKDPTLVNERGAHDFPVMFFALLGGGSVEMAELLHESGVPVDQETMGTTTLHWCVKRGDQDLAEWLLEKGADPEPVGYSDDRNGLTPLALARRSSRSAMIEVLRDAGALR